MEENRNMENLEKEEIVTDLEVYNNDQEIITEPEETEEANGNGSTLLLAFAVGAAIGGAALGINKLLKIRKDRKIKKESERFEKEVKDRLSKNGFSDEEIENILNNVLDKDEESKEEPKEEKKDEKSKEEPKEEKKDEK